MHLFQSFMKQVFVERLLHTRNFVEYCILKWIGFLYSVLYIYLYSIIELEGASQNYLFQALCLFLVSAQTTWAVVETVNKFNTLKISFWIKMLWSDLCFVLRYHHAIGKVSSLCGQFLCVGIYWDHWVNYLASK